MVIRKQVYNMEKRRGEGYSEIDLNWHISSQTFLERHKPTQTHAACVMPSSSSSFFYLYGYEHGFVLTN